MAVAAAATDVAAIEAGDVVHAYGRPDPVRHAELPRVLRRAVGLMRFTRKAVGATASSFFLVDPSAGTLHGIVSEWDWTRTSFPSQLSAWPTIARSLADGAMRTITARDAEGAEAGWFEPRGIAMTVCVPLRAPHPLGILFFDFAADAGRLGDRERALLVDAGMRTSRALYRSLSDARGLDPALLSMVAGSAWHP